MYVVIGVTFDLQSLLFPYYAHEFSFILKCQRRYVCLSHKMVLGSMYKLGCHSLQHVWLYLHAVNVAVNDIFLIIYFGGGGGCYKCVHAMLKNAIVGENV